MTYCFKKTLKGVLGVVVVRKARDLPSLHPTEENHLCISAENKALMQRDLSENPCCSPTPLQHQHYGAHLWA